MYGIEMLATMRMMMLTIRVLSIVMFADGEVDNKRSDYVDEDKGHDVCEMRLKLTTIRWQIW